MPWAMKCEVTHPPTPPLFVQFEVCCSLAWCFGVLVFCLSFVYKKKAVLSRVAKDVKTQGQKRGNRK
jgi:hypothetical protein